MYLLLLNTCTCMSEQSNLKISLKKDLVINSDNIGNINEVQVDGKGQIFINDGLNQCIHLYSSKGNFIRKIGRRGEAPGEYQYIWGIKITKGDSLVVYDGILYRLTIYAPGNFDSPVKIIKIPHAGNKAECPGVVGNVYCGSSGLWLPKNNCKEFLIIYSTPYSSNDITQKQKYYSYLYRISGKGELLQKKPVLTIEDVERLVVTSGKGRFMVSSMPFGRIPVIRLNMYGIIYYAETNNFSITAIDLEGKKKNEIRYKTDRNFITNKLWQNELKNYAGLGLKDIEKSKMPVPKHLPIFDDFTIDDEDNIWVAVNEKNYRSYKYHVFNKKGKLISMIPIHDKTVIKIINKGFAYGIKTDDLGIQSIVKYKVEKTK